MSFLIICLIILYSVDITRTVMPHFFTHALHMFIHRAQNGEICTLDYKSLDTQISSLKVTWKVRFVLITSSAPNAVTMVAEIFVSSHLQSSTCMNGHGPRVSSKKHFDRSNS